MYSAWSPRKIALRPVSGWVRDRRHLGLLLRRHGVVAVPARAREIQIVDGLAPLDPLPSRAHALIGGIHVGELRLAVLLRHDLRVHHGRLPGAVAPGTVGVPVHGALVGMLAVRLAVGVDIAQLVDLRVLGTVVLVHDVDLHLAEAARERNLRCGREIDVAEQNQLVVEERLIDLVEQRLIDGVGQRDTDYLASQCCMQRLDLERPISSRVVGRRRSTDHGFLLTR
jgi:hypothetical protein